MQESRHDGQEIFSPLGGKQQEMIDKLSEALNNPDNKKGYRT